MKSTGLLMSILALFLLTVSSGWAATIHVPEDYPVIQLAIWMAVDGDTILVADGTYTGAGNKDIDLEGKAITVVSENGPDFTVIDCENDGRGFYFISGEESDTWLDGFTIKNGFVEYDGGGIYCGSSSPTITNCIITGNRAYDYGGGILCSDSSPTIMNCTISENIADYGGGILCFNSSPTITNCTITRNRTSSSPFYNNGGGGILCSDSSPILSDCSISENWCDGFGGGIYCRSNSSPTLTDCTVSGNTTSGKGGGFYCNDSSPTIMNCTISMNTAENRGGGIYCCDSSPDITNCTIFENKADKGGGIYIRYWSYPRITNTTISENVAFDTYAGGAIYCYSPTSSPFITNCILWNDFPNEINRSSGNPNVTYSDIQGGWDGDGNIDEDPQFVPFPIYCFEYLLQPDSPCIDTGDPNIRDWLYDWHWRYPDWYVDGSRSNMGAYGGPGNIDWLDWLD